MRRSLLPALPSLFAQWRETAAPWRHILLSGLAGLLLAACGQSAPDGLRFGLAAAPVTLDPRYATDAESSRVNRLLYRALVDFDASLRPVPDLATWEELGPTHYRFHLGAEGRRFHDGSRLSAEDVKATYDFVLDPANASPHRGALAQIEALEARDADTLDFFLKQPDSLFPGRLVIGIVPAAAARGQAPLNRRPLGSGPFRFEDWPEEGHLRLRRERDGQRVEFVVSKDPVVRVLKLLRGELDLVQGELSPELVTWLERRADVRIEKGKGSNFTYLGFNLQDPVTGQHAVREAVAHAIDRQAIIRHVLGGAARPASALLPPDHWAGHPDLPLYAYDPQRARALLTAAGFDERHPARLIYKTSSNPFRIRLATVIGHQLQEAGIQVELRTYDWGTFYSDIKAGRFQMFSLSWVGIKMPDIFRYAFHSSAVPPAGANRGRFASPEVDRLIEQAERAATLEEQAVLYRQVQARLLQELPYVPLWYEDLVLVARPSVSGYALAPDGNYDGLNSARKE